MNLSDLVSPCSVCLEEFTVEKGRGPSRLRQCGHVFHLDCLDNWFKRNKICPYCRLAVNPSTDIQPDFVLKDIIEKISKLPPTLSPQNESPTNYYQLTPSSSGSSVASSSSFASSSSYDSGDESKYITALSPVHQHVLTTVKSTDIYPYGWICDICERHDPPGLMSHCYSCKNFDACEVCCNVAPVKSTTHPHPLIKIDPEKVYTTNNWECDNCNEQGVEMFHCYTCKNYDECHNCVLHTNEVVNVRSHEHQLEEAEPTTFYPRGKWVCDGCSITGTEKMYHCSTCGDFDMCVKCVQRS